MFKKTTTRGFTLIELLVVISIISLLASIVLSALKTANIKARDARRALDIEQIVNAMNLFYNQYGCLPFDNGSTTCSGAAGYNNHGAGGYDYSSNGSGTGFMSFLQTSGAISKVPVDPVNNMPGDSTANTYSYSYYCYPNGPHLGYWKESPSWTYVYVIGSSSTSWTDPNYTCK